MMSQSHPGDKARLYLVLTLVICGIVLASTMQRGWFPHDEGALGQSAERLLRGEVPHRDYDEIYTGLLTYLHALAFKVLGIDAAHLRIPLALATLGWIACCFRILVRFVSPSGATLLSMLILLYSVPNYPAPIPSWYNLFLATGGVLAVIKWHEDKRSGWLVLAGFLGGISFLMKLSGVFYLIGASIGLVAYLLTTAPQRPLTRHRAGLPTAMVVGAATWVAVMLLILGPNPRELLRFLLPTGGLVIAVAVAAVRGHRIGFLPSWKDLAGLMVPFAAGTAIPLGMAIIWALLNGALGAVVEGVFILPFRRTGFASHAPPETYLLAGAIPLLWLLWPRATVDNRQRVVVGLVGVILLLVLLLVPSEPGVYRAVWGAVWSVPLIVALSAAFLLCRSDLKDRFEGGAPLGLAAALSSISAFAILVEFPFATPIYSLYVVPLSILAAVALARVRGGATTVLQRMAVVFLLAFGLFALLPGNARNLGRSYWVSPDSVPLPLSRASLLVSPRDASTYSTLIGVLDSLAPGRTLWAGPDSPQIYFLSGVRNQTRTIFDFLDREPIWGPDFMRKIDSIGVSLVVLRLGTEFSPVPTPEVIESLRDRFPRLYAVSGWLVFW